jgi:peptidoglycan hydrolase-like protein with peptidoglycan-binding domain
MLLKALFVAPVFALVSDSSIYAGDLRYDSTSQEVWPRNLVREVQSRLVALGFDPGPVDGVYGPQTRQGIIAFQKAHNLQVDGKISNKLIGALGLE